MTGPQGVEVPDALAAGADEIAAVLRTITDPIARAWAAENALERQAVARGVLLEVRREALGAAKAQGRTWVAIGTEFGVTGSRVQQIVEGKKP